MIFPVGIFGIYLFLKKIFNTQKNQFVTFKEIYQDSAIFQDRKKIAEHWRQKGWEIIDNTPEEIVDILDEMLKKLNNQWQISDEDKQRQIKFWQSFPLELPENLNCYEDVKLQLSNNFLKKNEYLLQ